jgi:hypothetical protein
MTLGEQCRKALELLAPPPSRHDHSDGGIPIADEIYYHGAIFIPMRYFFSPAGKPAISPRR